MAKEVQISFRADEDFKNEVLEQAKKEDRSMASLYISVMRRYLIEQRQKEKKIED